MKKKVIVGTLAILALGSISTVGCSSKLKEEPKVVVQEDNSRQKEEKIEETKSKEGTTSMKESQSGRWVGEGSDPLKRKYVLKDGSFYKSILKEVEGQYYYFGENGYPMVGILSIDENGRLNDQGQLRIFDTVTGTMYVNQELDLGQCDANGIYMPYDFSYTATEDASGNFNLQTRMSDGEGKIIEVKDWFNEFANDIYNIRSYERERFADNFRDAVLDENGMLEDIPEYNSVDVGYVSIGLPSSKTSPDIYFLPYIAKKLLDERPTDEGIVEIGGKMIQQFDDNIYDYKFDYMNDETIFYFILQYYRGEENAFTSDRLKDILQEMSEE